MRSLRHILTEALWSIPKEQITRLGVAIFSKTEQDNGVTPDLGFDEIVEAYDKVDIVQTAIQNLAAEISVGFETESDNPTAKKTIDDWNTKNDLDSLMHIWSIELIMCGNSFNTATANGLIPIPLKSVEKALPVDKTTPMFREYWLKMYTGSYNQDIVKDFVHFRVNMTSSSMPFGTGVVQKLLSSRTTDIPNMIDVYEKIRKAMLRGFERSGWGEQIWILKDAPDKTITDTDAYLKDATDQGKRVVTNLDADIKSSTLERSKAFDQWLADNQDLLFIVMGDPLLKSTIMGNFSEASARAVFAMHKSKIRQYQRVLKRQIEALWRQVLHEALFSEDVQVKLVFNEDIPEQTQPTKKEPAPVEPVKEE